MLNNDVNGKLRLTLIDFGYAKQIKEPYDPNEELDFFDGNFLFSSAHCLDFKVPRPKDDLISLGYLLVFLLNKNELPFFGPYKGSKNLDKLTHLNLMRGFKSIYSVK